MEIKEAILRAVNGEAIPEEDAFNIMTFILKGQATPAQIASLATALRMKGEEIGEITGFARAMREASVKVRIEGVEIVDTCGTGGDGSNTFNISTAAAFVVAGAGITVAKHGNRSISSKCGSADVLQNLGVNILLGPSESEACMREAGIAFLFAPVFHSAMKHAAAPRNEIAIRTVFNILGPLTNPAGAGSQLLGVYSESLVEKMAYVLLNLGSKSAMVVHGEDGLDEISISGETLVSRLKEGKVHTFLLNPAEYGIKTRGIEELAGGAPEENAAIISSVLSGEKGAKREVVLINAAAGIIVGGGASDFEAGIKAAAAAVDSGRAMEKLEILRKISNEL